MDSENIVITSPCIGVCSTTFGDEVCRGCKRTVEEIAQWPAMDNSLKIQTMNTINSFILPLIKQYFEIIDEELFKEKLATHKIKYHSFADPYIWILNLLKKGRYNIEYFTKYGFRLINEQHSLEDLYELIHKQSFKNRNETLNT